MKISLEDFNPLMDEPGRSTIWCWEYIGEDGAAYEVTGHDIKMGPLPWKIV